MGNLLGEENNGFKCIMGTHPAARVCSLPLSQCPCSLTAHLLTLRRARLVCNRQLQPRALDDRGGCQPSQVRQPLGFRRRSALSSELGTRSAASLDSPRSRL